MRNIPPHLLGADVKILSVEAEEHQAGIILPDLQSVKGALQVYASGVTSGSHAVRKQLVADGAGHVAMALDIIESNPNSFASMLCNDIEETMSTSNRFERSFDYGGPGPFRKAHVIVERLGNGEHLLGLYAAYVGREIEEGLAQYIGARRALAWAGVNITVEAAQDDKFTIDFAPIMDALKGSRFEQSNSQSVAEIIAAGYKEDYETRPMRGGRVDLSDDVDIEVILSISDITVESYYHEPFVADGMTVTGGLRDWGTGIENPRVQIVIRRRKVGDEYRSELNDIHQAFMREMAAELKQLLTP